MEDEAEFGFGDEFDLLVNLPPGFRARIGLNETSLTKSLARGDFTLAEKIIEETTDPEFLNDGALAATPLNMVLTGRSSFFHQSRNLKLAQLLLARGANPNLRIPNHDLETASESPLELLLSYYLKLVEVFGLPGSGQCRPHYRPGSFQETELMDTIGLQGEVGGLGPGHLTLQARQLLLFCLERGGDPNLPTTDAARSIYHVAVTAPVQDPELVQRMLEIGANINLADVHNTTPLMDIISLGCEARARSALASLCATEQPLLLDNQNCSQQSALWRAVHQGHGLLARELAVLGAGWSCAARVAALPRPRLARSTPLQLPVPALLAPFLADSPCTSNLHVGVPRRQREGRAAVPVPRVQWSHAAVRHVQRHHVAGLVDRGAGQGEREREQLAGLVRAATEHSQVADSGVVEPTSLAPLMFGQLTAGLRQLAVRAVFQHTLFSVPAVEAGRRLERVCRSSGLLLTQLLVPPSASRLATTRGSSPDMTYEYEIELGSEVELSLGDTTVQHDSSSDTSEDESGEAGELLERIARLDREMEGIRTESLLTSLDRDLATWELELQATLDRIQRYQAALTTSGELQPRTVQRSSNWEIEEARRRSEELMEELRVQRRILVKSDKDIEEVEERMLELGLTEDGGTGDQLDLDGQRRKIDENWSLGSCRALQGEGEQHTEQLVPTLAVSVSLPALPLPFRPGTPPSPPPGLPRRVSSQLDSDSSDSTRLASSTWSGAGSSRQGGTCQAALLSRLTPRTLYALTDRLGVPHALRPCFALEAAALQLSLALGRHRSITCDRNCEGEDSEESEDSDTDWESGEDGGGMFPGPPVETTEDTEGGASSGSLTPDSSVSGFSARSWFGSPPELSGAERLSPRSFSSSSSSSSSAAGWLSDTEELRRVRSFLQTEPGPNFTHSTDSEDSDL